MLISGVGRASADSMSPPLTPGSRSRPSPASVSSFASNIGSRHRNLTMTPGHRAEGGALGGPPPRHGRSRGPATRPDLPAGPAAASPILRSAGPGDAAALLRLKQRLDSETSFM